MGSTYGRLTLSNGLFYIGKTLIDDPIRAKYISVYFNKGVRYYDIILDGVMTSFAVPEYVVSRFVSGDYINIGWENSKCVIVRA